MQFSDLSQFQIRICFFRIRFVNGDRWVGCLEVVLGGLARHWSWWRLEPSFFGWLEDYSILSSWLEGQECHVRIVMECWVEQQKLRNRTEWIMRHKSIQKTATGLWSLLSVNFSQIVSQVPCNKHNFSACMFSGKAGAPPHCFLRAVHVCWSCSEEHSCCFNQLIGLRDLLTLSQLNLW